MNDAFLQRHRDLEAISERVRIRPVESRDAAETARLMDESVAAELISWTSPMSEEEARERIKRAQETQAERATINFAILDPTGDALMGWIGFWQEEDGRVFTGYWLGLPFQRQGLIIEAVRLALPIALRFFAVEHIWARVRSAHLPSIKVLDRLGFDRAGETDGLEHFVLAVD